MHRIPHGKNEVETSNGTEKPVLFLQHGLLSSSSDWVLAGPNRSLGFIISNLPEKSNTIVNLSVVVHRFHCGWSRVWCMVRELPRQQLLKGSYSSRPFRIRVLGLQVLTALQWEHFQFSISHDSDSFFPIPVLIKWLITTCQKCLVTFWTTPNRRRFSTRVTPWGQRRLW